MANINESKSSEAKLEQTNDERLGVSKITRREVLQLLSWTMAIPVFFGLNTRAMAGSPAPVDLTQLELAALEYFKKLGYTRLPAMNLITGHKFNHGLRFDDTPQSYPPGQTIRIQNCARMEDISKDRQAGVLPYFHIFSLITEKPAFRGQLLTQLLDYLITEVKLDPTRVALVSTDSFKPYLSHLAPLAIKAEQFVQRDRKEAMAKGDGSGYFNPQGHPHVNGMHTVSIHYARNAGDKEQALKYPLPGYWEIAEVVIEPDSGESLPLELVSLGLERLLLAQGKAIDSFAASRQKALVAIKAEAKRHGVALPKGYHDISNS